jgi:hypothetical protein
VSYPVTFEADYTEQRSRLTTFFRLILLIPAAVVLYVFGIVASIAIVIAWFAIVITGRYPEGLYKFVADFNRFLARVTAYGVLLTDQYPVRMQFAGPLEQYSRLKTFFRIILAIPIMVLRYVMTLLLEVGAFAAWFVILVTGKMPRGLFDLMVLGNSYTARSDAYVYLLTETYPPFQDDVTRTAGTPGPTPPQAPSPS